MTDILGMAGPAPTANGSYSSGPQSHLSLPLINTILSLGLTKLLSITALLVFRIFSCYTLYLQ